MKRRGGKEMVDCRTQVIKYQAGLVVIALLLAVSFALPGNLFAGAVKARLSSNDGSDAFQVMDNYSSVLMHVGSDGNVGVGTTSPAVKLQVYDGGTPAPYSVGTDKLVVIGAGNSAVNITAGSTADSGVLFSDPDDRDVGSIDYDHNNDSMRLRVNNGTKMFIESTGNVGIGTTSPGQKLSVTGIVESSTGGFKFPDGTTQTTAAAGGGQEKTIAKAKTEDESVLNSTALQDDDHLQFSIGANEIWVFEIFLMVDAASAAPDINVSLQSPGTPVALDATVMYGTSSGVQWGASDFKRITANNGISSKNWGAAPSTFMEIRGTVENGATAGIFKFRWAQRAASATIATIVKRGSSLKADRVF